MEAGVVEDGARVVTDGSLDVDAGKLVESVPGDVVSDVELSEHDTIRIEETINVAKILFGYRRS